MKKIGLVVVAFCLALLPVSPALAHGDIESTQPEPEQVSEKAPKHVKVTFTEAPTEDGRMAVIDGCGENVKREQYVEGRTMHVLLNKGQPGKWTVSYAVISAEDGHKTNGKYSFTVDGEAECSEAEPKPEKSETAAEPSEGVDAAADPDAPPASDEADGIPTAVVVIGFVALIGIALLVRMGTSRD